MATFWETYKPVEYVSPAKARRLAERAASLAACSQDKPSRCYTCNTVKADTLLGICGDCFAPVPAG